jgi:glycerophosphoryl diester phosphodiesterase
MDIPDFSRRGFMGVAGGVATVAALPAVAAEARPKPLIYAHRGCSALRPEHTLAAYAKAIQDGADLIEPDLVITRDGVLVARHESNIADTTDVAAHPEFADRKTRKTISGRPYDGWFAEDFTLAELKTLRAVERLKGGRVESHTYDGEFQIVTFEEIIDFAAAESAARGRLIGISPELKQPTFYSEIGLPVEDRFIDRLGRHSFASKAPIHVQCFETASLRTLRRRFPRSGNVQLVQLVVSAAFVPPDIEKAGGKTTYKDMCTAAGLREVATYADVLAPLNRDVIPLGAGDRLGRPTTIVADAHAAGLRVVPWTFVPENRYMAADFRTTAGEDARNFDGSVAEIRHYIATGIDGFFTDDPAAGRAALAGT